MIRGTGIACLVWRVEAMVFRSVHHADDDDFGGCKSEETGMVRAFAFSLMWFLLAGCSQTRSHSTATADARPVVVLMDTSEGRITLELDNVLAPISTANFLMYTRNGAYDGTVFHRVIKDFVIQGGGFEQDLTERALIARKAGNPDQPIRNEWRNGLKNLRGTIAMARDTEPDTATREFYINVVDNPKLDTAREKTGNAGYAVFGRVVEGMDVVDRIRSVETRTVKAGEMKSQEEMKDVPLQPVHITRVRVSELRK